MRKNKHTSFVYFLPQVHEYDLKMYCILLQKLHRKYFCIYLYAMAITLQAE